MREWRERSAPILSQEIFPQDFFPQIFPKNFSQEFFGLPELTVVGVYAGVEGAVCSHPLPSALPLLVTPHIQTSSHFSSHQSESSSESPYPLHLCIRKRSHSQRNNNHILYEASRKKTQNPSHFSYILSLPPKVILTLCVLTSFSWNEQNCSALHSVLMNQLQYLSQSTNLIKRQ